MIFLWMVMLFVIVRPTYEVLYSCNSTAVCGCSNQPAVLTRIVGGEDAGIATWGWAVSLLIAGSDLCGGTVISASWIITAAHCSVDLPTGANITIYAGSNNWFDGQSRVASQIIVHPDYDPDSKINDIALLKLISPLNMSDPAVSSICLPSVNSRILEAGEWPAANTPVVAVGWGTLTTNGTFPIYLQQVTLQTVDYQTAGCVDLLYDPTVQLCASDPNHMKDTCEGDSGAPLMMFTSNNQWVQVGLASYGRNCADPYYSAVYTRIAAFEKWIKSYATDSNWIVLGSHANTISSSAFNLFFFIVLIFFVTFHY